jgi:hypothetical protein
LLFQLQQLLLLAGADTELYHKAAPIAIGRRTHLRAMGRLAGPVCFGVAHGVARGAPDGARVAVEADRERVLGDVDRDDVSADRDDPGRADAPLDGDRRCPGPRRRIGERAPCSRETCSSVSGRPAAARPAHR